MPDAPVRARRGLLAVLALGTAIAMPGGARADRQRDAGLGAVLEAAIAAARCDGHDDRYGEEVFLRLQEPRLRALVRDAQLRVEILRQVYCEAHAVAARYHRELRFDLRLTPELVLAVIDVESRFDRYAVSRSGAVGLMQVMPFWPRRLGVENRLFGSVDFNVHLGCEILAYYMHLERNDYRRALERYNGSVGRREYPDQVLTRLSGRWRA